MAVIYLICLLFIVTLHVSVWVEIPEWTNIFKLNSSRSTWACELKFKNELLKMPLKSHAPRERVSWNSPIISFEISFRVTLHVSVWVEIDVSFDQYANLDSHAPRERVSWNFKALQDVVLESVTLHVSVWVEMLVNSFINSSEWSRSTWACELKFSDF